MQPPPRSTQDHHPGPVAQVGSVDVLWARPVHSDRLSAMLSSPEQSRLSALRAPADRDRFVSAHALLRLLVAQRWDLRPADVTVEALCPRCGGPHGRPTVRAPTGQAAIHVSMAHAGDRVVVASTELGPVGVDVEATSAAGFPGFDAVALAASEHRGLALQAPARRDESRAAIWVRKEAVLKATGLGLSVDLREMAVSPPSQPARLVSWPTRPPGGPDVHLTDLDVGCGHSACLALLAAQPGRLSLRRGDAWLRDES